MSLDGPKAAVKTAWKLLVETLGGVEATSAACGIARSLVSEYGNRNGDRYPPAHTIIAAEKVAGEPLVTAALARAQGYELMLVEAPRHASALADVVAETGRDVGELFATAAHALKKQRPTKREMADLLREFGDMHRVAGEALALLKAMEAADE
jgi:hypothetical protein